MTSSRTGRIDMSIMVLCLLAGVLVGVLGTAGHFARAYATVMDEPTGRWVWHQYPRPVVYGRPGTDVPLNDNMT